jgi:hypothetical protein
MHKQYKSTNYSNLVSDLTEHRDRLSCDTHISPARCDMQSIDILDGHEGLRRYNRRIIKTQELQSKPWEYDIDANQQDYNRASQFSPYDKLNTNQDKR